MMFTLFIALIFSGAAAFADQFRTVKVDASTGDYELVYSYPQFLPTSVPGFAQINVQLENWIEQDQCERPEPGELSRFYLMKAVVVGLNPRYVGVKLTGSSFCGGAHPNHYVVYLSFDSKTGAGLDIEKDFGFTGDYASDDKIRRKLAGLLARRLPNAGQDGDGCYEGLNRAEVIDALTMYSPTVHGLAKGKTVVLGVTPPYSGTPCRFEARFSYDEIKGLLTADSQLHQLLR